MIENVIFLVIVTIKHVKMWNTTLGNGLTSLSSNHTFPVIISYVYRLPIASLRNALIVQIPIAPHSHVWSNHKNTREIPDLQYRPV